MSANPKKREWKHPSPRALKLLRKVSSSSKSKRPASDVKEDFEYSNSSSDDEEHSIPLKESMCQNSSQKMNEEGVVI